MRQCGKKYDRAGQATDDNIILRMHTECRITRPTDTQSQCVIPTAFPRQQWLRKAVSVLRYTYSAWLVIYVITSTSYPC
jgi:hypothetical protein